MDKIVVFTQRVEYIKDYGERRDAIDQRIVSFIMKCGYVPVPLPNNKKVVEKIIETLKPTGIVLTGGNSLTKYGGDAPERDEVDMYLIDYSINHKVPLLGICRGMQSILDYYSVPLTNVKNHVAVKHNISGLEQERLVNSYHNQGAISFKNPELSIVCVSDDGVVEMVRNNHAPMAGIMWHPEREVLFNQLDIDIVRRLFN